ncbi:MAG: hypothetical protein JNM25_08525 [Planctomycetes bacterium]|nr:hypothetical protein [Planctomycetota bacterium]
MPSEPMSHPDRVAATLANVDVARAARGSGPFAEPGPGAFDCRIDLKLLLWQANAAAARSPRARDHLARLDLARRPDLRAGTVQDGVARGLAAALEEVVSLAPPTPAPEPPPFDPVRMQSWTGRELRKKKDLLVRSGGPRVRFSRREGLLYVDRDDGLHSGNCLRFEARRDLGTLDGFVADDAERPRLYSAQFLQPQRYLQAGDVTELELAGRLGRGPIGWPCRLLLRGHTAEPSLELVLRLDQRLTGWRLRARFLGIPAAAIAHDCTPVAECVQNDAGGFVAVTLVRANDALLVDGRPVPVPAAACRGEIVHRFRLGAGPTGP